MKNPELERVRRFTSQAANDDIDDLIALTIADYADASEADLTERIDQLDREWDIERALQTNAAVISLTGIGLGATVDRRWLALPVGVLGFLLLHSTLGWCPPLPALRKAGIRTRGEIDRERFALKFLRGDFAGVRKSSGHINVAALVAAVEA